MDHIHKWGTFEPTDTVPTIEIIPIDEDGWMSKGHARGLNCRCKPFYCLSEDDSDLDKRIFVVHNCLELGFDCPTCMQYRQQRDA